MEEGCGRRDGGRAGLSGFLLSERPSPGGARVLCPQGPRDRTPRERIGWPVEGEMGFLLRAPRGPGKAARGLFLRRVFSHLCAETLGARGLAGPGRGGGVQSAWGRARGRRRAPAKNWEETDEGRKQQAPPR